MTAQRQITSAEAAARLGIKLETLYAYVSRGILSSQRRGASPSLFDADEVDALVRSRVRPRAGRVETVISSALTHVVGGRLFIRGHDVAELVRQGASFERVAELLWTSELPTDTCWSPPPDVVAGIAAAQAAMPEGSNLLDRLKLGAVVSGAMAASPSETEVDASAFGPLLAALTAGLPLRGREGAGGLAELLWPRLTARRASPAWLSALDAALVLLADHDLAASTFAVRVSASARNDVYSVLLTGLSVVGGRLHGAASAPLHVALTGRDRPPGLAAGFGHFLYPAGDPRAEILLELVEAAAARSRWQHCRRVLDEYAARTGRASNVDAALACLTACADMTPDAGEAIFALARSAGWLAHAVEEYTQRPLRFRPTTRYTGPVDRWP